MSTTATSGPDRAERIVRERLCVHCRQGSPVDAAGGHAVTGQLWSGWDACGYEVGQLDGRQVAELLRVSGVT